MLIVIFVESNTISTPNHFVHGVVKKGLLRDSNNSEWRLRQLTSEQEKVFIELGLIKRPVVEKKRKGRPPGNKNRPKVQ